MAGEGNNGTSSAAFLAGNAAIGGDQGGDAGAIDAGGEADDAPEAELSTGIENIDDAPQDTDDDGNQIENTDDGEGDEPPADEDDGVDPQIVADQLLSALIPQKESADEGKGPNQGQAPGQPKPPASKPYIDAVTKSITEIDAAGMGEVAAALKPVLEMLAPALDELAGYKEAAQRHAQAQRAEGERKVHRTMDSIAKSQPHLAQRLGSFADKTLNQQSMRARETLFQAANILINANPDWTPEQAMKHAAKTLFPAPGNKGVQTPQRRVPPKPQVSRTPAGKPSSKPTENGSATFSAQEKQEISRILGS